MINKKLRVLLIVFALITLISGSIFATEPVTTSAEPTGEVPTTGTEAGTEEEIVSKDMYYSGDDIVIDGLIDGNVFAIGKNITITKETIIAGDACIIAEKLNIEGEMVEVEGKETRKCAAIYQNLFALAGEANVNGAMYSAYITCDTLNMGYTCGIIRDLSVVASKVTIDGIVERDAKIETNELTLDTYCVIGGNLDYRAKQAAVYNSKETEESEVVATTDIPAGIVQGKITQTDIKKDIIKKDIAKTVSSIMSRYGIDKDTTEEELRNIITSTMFDLLGVKTRSEAAKANSGVIIIPVLYVYVFVGVLAGAIIAGVVIVIVKKEKPAKENKETK